MSEKPDSDETPEVTSEAASQEDDLDSILNEWESSEEPPKKEAPSNNTPSQDPMLAEIYHRMAQEDLSKAVDMVYSELEDLPATPSKTFLRDTLEGMATRNDKFRTAWTKRHAAPEMWEKAVSAVGKDFKKQFQIKEASSDTSEVESAMAIARGSSTKEVPEKPVTNKDLSKLSDREFEMKYFSGD
jgi:hypothetical protein